jgi:pimeloyl-ACP methyl ester carboxylesterase
VASPPTGDILKYQVRGEEIRKFIADTVEAVEDDEVIVLAHSLGGVACVDLLISQSLPKVKLLVTVGSQAPYLYEIDALWSLRPGMRLPGHFSCKWLNIYDRNDFLSYKCAAVFGSDRVTDKVVASGAPFPDAHSAYFGSKEVWELIEGAIA